MIVLIVEDEPLIAGNLALVLEAAGHAVIGPAPSSAVAIALAQHSQPDLALVDINLDGRPDGVKLARALQLLGIPSVFMSAQHALAFANRDAALGFIEKPYSAANVCESLEVVDAMLNGYTPPARTGVLELFSQTQ